MPGKKRALISVYDKTGIAEFARQLLDLGFEILSTGGTARHLNENGVPTRSISAITGFPEIMDGRVKTLHPKIFGGVLALRGNPTHMRDAGEHGIELLDLVAVNLYPFEQTVAREGVSLSEALENIDIGGPAMIRAAAKNHVDVTVVTSPEQYAEVIRELRASGGNVSAETRQKLAAAAFWRTSQYDLIITEYLSALHASDPHIPDRVVLPLVKVRELRYGENPHQKAALFRKTGEAASGLLQAKQLHGKELSYNNFLDLNAGLEIVQEFDRPCSVVVKHTNPCGIAVHESLHQAFLNAKATDPVSAFGGILGFNRDVDGETASAISEMFIEAVIAPGFTGQALERLRTKKNLRLLQTGDAGEVGRPGFDIKHIQGGYLLQDQDFHKSNDIDFKVVTTRQPTEAEWAALKFGWRVVKHVKSNAIVYAAPDRTLGIGAGQMSRVDSSRIAVAKARRMGLSLAGAAVASDAFFPFRDGVDAAAEAGATAVVQPGGSIRDQEVIAAANEHDMVMVFTGVRHFRH